jgi:hypothetical protein
MLGAALESYRSSGVAEIFREEKAIPCWHLGDVLSGAGEKYIE